MSLYDKSASFRNNGESTVKTSSQTQKEEMSLTSQSLRTLITLRNSCLIRLKLISRRRSTVTHTDDPFSAVRSSTRLIFGGPQTLILSALSLSSSALSELTTFYASIFPIILAFPYRRNKYQKYSTLTLVDPGCRAVFLETKSTHSPQ